MSIHVASIVWRTELGGPSVKAVAMKLADCADDKGGNVYPSVRRVAREAEISPRTVQTAIAALINLGVLELVGKGGRGPGDTNEYRFNLDVLWELRAKTERRWKEEDDQIKGANSAPISRTSRRTADNYSGNNRNSKNAENDGDKGANSASLKAKGANSASKGANPAEKGAAAAPNPSLTRQLDSSLKTRDAREAELNFDLVREGQEASPQRKRQLLKISRVAGVLYRPDPPVRDEARRLARGWELDGPDGLVSEFNGMNEGNHLHDADAAFLGFCRKKGTHPDTADGYVLKPTGQPLPTELRPRDGEIAIPKSSASWDRWLIYLESVDKPSADRMRKAFVIFALTPDPESGSSVPRIPVASVAGKNHRGKAA